MSDRTAGFDRRLVTPMLLGTVLNPVNSSMIAVALIPIGAALGAPPAETAWLVTGLYLATAIGQPVMGRLVDMYGPRRLYLVGTALVGVAGLLGTVAPSLGVLVAARVLLGFGTSAAYPAAMYLTRSEAERTGRASPTGVLTGLSVAGQVTAVVGPTLGGLLIGLGGWHTIFAVNVPLALACLILGARYLPRPAAGERPALGGEAARNPAASGGLAHSSAAPRGLGRLDLPGMVLFAAAIVALLLFVMAPRVSDLYLLAIALAAGAGFAVRELRAAEPFIDLRVLGGNAPLVATYARQFLAYVTSYAFLYGYTQWLEDGRGLGASAAGLVLLPLSAAGVLIALATGRRAAVRGKLLAGSALQVLACAAMLLTGATTPLWALLALGALMGLPQGLNGLANQNALYHQADATRMGSAAGLLRTFTYVGAMAASAANAAAFTDGATTGGLHRLALIMIVPGVLLLALTLADRSLRRVGADPRKDRSMPLTTLDPNTALVVIDLQKGIAGAPGTPHASSDVIARNTELADAFRKHDLPVVLVRVSLAADGADGAPGRTDAGASGREYPDGWDEIIDDLAGHPEDVVVTKRNWGAFYGTDLDLQLRRRGVTQIVLTGVATSIGVEFTARAAHEHGYHVTLATDAMTDIDADAHHNSVERIFPKLGETATTAQVIAALN